MPGLGPPELLLIAGVVVLLFGAKKLPEFARSLGKAKNEFKRGLEEGDKEKAEKAELAGKAEKAEVAEKAELAGKSEKAETPPEAR
jgi:sec-independent protein translocase protein TatA